VVVDTSLADGLMLADGVALDDHLGSDARIAVDVECRERYRQWRARHAQALTVEGVDLAHVWEVELIAKCFLPGARLRHGLPAVFADSHVKRMVTSIVDPGVQRLVAAIAACEGVAVADGVQESVEREQLRRSPSPLGLVAGKLGVPARVRGEVLSLAYWNTFPLLARLAWRRGGPRIVACPLPVRNIGAGNAVALAARGGWTGMPGARARASSRDALAATIQQVPRADRIDPLDTALDGFALETLARISLDTLAYVRHLRRALRHGRVRAGLLPFDSPEQARMLLPALRETGAHTLLVQHGFSGRLGDPDMLLADHVAVWCERDRSLAQGRDPSTITVTGNPGAAHFAGIVPRRAQRCGRSVLLVDYAGRVSVRVDSRISKRHVGTALSALASARPGSHVVIRPHPSDLALGAYATLAAAHPNLNVEVDARTPIEALLAAADLCVGSVSTATLQACALGVPTVVLNMSAFPRPWPFQGSALPSAADADALAVAIVATLRSGEVAGREEALEALGVRTDAVERVLELVAQLAR